MILSRFLLLKTIQPEETQKTVDDYLAATGTDAVESESGRYMLKDGYNGTIFLAWKDKQNCYNFRSVKRSV